MALSTERHHNRGQLTEVRDDAAVLLQRVLHTLQGVVDGAEGEDDVGQFALQRFQVVAVDAFDHAVAVDRSQRSTAALRAAASAGLSTCRV